jgi:hypothetical protein
MGHVGHSGSFELRNIDALFFTIGWAQYGYLQNRIETHYIRLVFLHLIGSAGRVMYFGASGA